MLLRRVGISSLQEIKQLGPADRKRVIEGLLHGPMTVYWDTSPLEDLEEPRVAFSAQSRFNREIFQWLLDQGKIRPIADPDLEDDPPEASGISGKNGNRPDKDGNDHCARIASAITVIRPPVELSPPRRPVPGGVPNGPNHAFPRSQ